MQDNNRFMRVYTSVAEETAAIEEQVQYNHHHGMVALFGCISHDNQTHIPKWLILQVLTEIRLYECFPVWCGLHDDIDPYYALGYMHLASFDVSDDRLLGGLFNIVRQVNLLKSFFDDIVKYPFTSHQWYGKSDVKVEWYMYPTIGYHPLH